MDLAGDPDGDALFCSRRGICLFCDAADSLPFLLNFMGIETSPRPGNYFGFVLNLMFWVGVSFEMPLVVFVLARLGIVNVKGLLKQWRIAVIASAVLSALITPTPDPVNMGLMMIPLLGLYLLSILFAVFAARQRKQEQGERHESV